jgi:5-methylcytosine-specific restriction endonuclease McrA
MMNIPLYLIITDTRAAYAARYHSIVPDNKELRRMAIKAYGGRCMCCGLESDHQLTLDHIEPVNGGTRKSYLTLWREGFPKDNLQLLCEPCNGSKANHKECKHMVIARHVIFNVLLLLNNQIGALMPTTHP